MSRNLFPDILNLWHLAGLPPAITPYTLRSLPFRSLTSLGLALAVLLRRFWTFPESTIPEVVDSTLPYPVSGICHP